MKGLYSQIRLGKAVIMVRRDRKVDVLHKETRDGEHDQRVPLCYLGLGFERAVKGSSICIECVEMLLALLSVGLCVSLNLTPMRVSRS